MANDTKSMFPSTLLVTELVTSRAYAQAGLSNRFCPSVVVVIVVVVVIKKLKNLSNGQFRGYSDS